MSEYAGLHRLDVPAFLKHMHQTQLYSSFALGCVIFPDSCHSLVLYIHLCIRVTLKPTKLSYASELSMIYTLNFKVHIMHRYRSNVIYKVPKVTYILCRLVSCGWYFFLLKNYCKLIITLLKCTETS
jgi:hypothetical protein